MIRRVLVLAGLTFAASALADPATLIESVPHVTTYGHASTAVVPDQADIRLGVSNERPTADEAAALTAKQAADVVTAIKASGIEPKDIKTDFDLKAQYDNALDPKTQSRRSTLRGYSADETIIVRVHNIAKAGALARLLIDKGANSFQGIDYSYADEKGLRRRLDGEAMKDALAAARTYTDAIGVALGRVIEIKEPDNNAASLPFGRMQSKGPRTAIPTEPGVQTIEQHVTATFEIEGKAR